MTIHQQKQELINSMDILGKTKTIMYVDDNKQSISNFKNTLQRQYKIIVVSSKKEAIDVLEKEKIDYTFINYNETKRDISLVDIINKFYPNIKIGVIADYMQGININYKPVFSKTFLFRDVNDFICA